MRFRIKDESLATNESTTNESIKFFIRPVIVLTVSYRGVRDSSQSARRTESQFEVDLL